MRVLLSFRDSKGFDSFVTTKVFNLKWFNPFTNTDHYGIDIKLLFNYYITRITRALCKKFRTKRIRLEVKKISYSSEKGITHIPIPCLSDISSLPIPVKIEKQYFVCYHISYTKPTKPLNGNQAPQRNVRALSRGTNWIHGPHNIFPEATFYDTI